MNVPFNNFKREYELLKSDIDDAVRGVMERGYFILGPEVEKFEKAFAAYDRAEVGIGVNSGTDALYLSMLAAGIGGDAPDFVEVGEAGIAMDDAMRRQRRVQLVG
jgi:dTDP-4-amino-4,6-dideoxygalactose transaminase